MEQKPYTLQQKAHVACFIILWIALLFFAIVMVFTMPAHALEINPSIHEKDPWWCENSATGWICGDKGSQGIQGINGTKGDPGEPNFTAIYYNATNFTAIANFTHFYNATNFNITSNYTVINGASFYNTTAINESYAYLPGRAGGQKWTGGINPGEDLILNASSNGGTTASNIILQPNGGGVIIGKTASSVGQVLVVSGGGGYGFASGADLGVDDDSDAIISIESPNTGSTRLVMGDQDDSTIALVDYNNVINAFRFYSNNAYRGIINSTGYWGINTMMPTTTLHIAGNIRVEGCGAGTVTSDAGGNFTCVSDSKAKTNIAPYPAGLAQVLQLAPKQYKYSADSGLDTQNTYVGFIAQDVEKVLPDAVKTKDDVKYEQKLLKKGATADEDEYTTVEVKTGTQTKSLDDRAIIAALVNAVKEQQVEINALNERIKKLEDEKT